MLNRIVGRLENWLFGHRALTLSAIAVFTAVMAVFAVQLKMDAGFEKQIPTGHEYVQTFQQYRGDLFGANRITVVIKANEGTIWTREGLTRLYQATQAVSSLPNVDKGSVKSLWTPNSFVNEITEEGFRADPIIAGTITPQALSASAIAAIRQSTATGGFVGVLVSRDQTSAMITAELQESGDPAHHLDYVAFNRTLEAELRRKFEDRQFQVQIIGFAKQIGDIAEGASGVLVFCVLAVLLTALAVYWYSRSVRFTVLPIICSLTSLIWQFGTLRLLGFGLDPLGVLVPFLVFAIGVSHGIQQINFIVRELSQGKSSELAARHSFSGLLVPGSLALVTALVSFVTLLLIPIPMVRELAVTASLGVGYKILTNLVMLPVAASLLNFSQAYAQAALAARERRVGWLKTLARVAEPRNAVLTLAATGVVFAAAVWQSSDRVVGTLQPGAPELRADSRYNRDAVAIAQNYDAGLDWLTVVFEAAASTDCVDPRVGKFQDRFVTEIGRVPGVVSVGSYAQLVKGYSQGYNEGLPKMSVIPLDATNYAGLSAEINRVRGYMTKDCKMTAVHLYLGDHKAATITRVIDAVKAFRAANRLEGVTIRLAAGNAGVIAATNDEVAVSEMPMMLYVYLAIFVLVLLAYRDLRAVVACCLPLTVATFIGYWFMKELEIGLTVATLPVMVLAVGIGVDYAFYIYNRLQQHLANQVPIVKAVEQSILEVGVATMFTALTLAVGVATWSFSELKFQADMGKLLAFMFVINLVMAMTALPALAVVLERLFPRKHAVKTSTLMNH